MLQQFEWKCHPKAEALSLKILEECCKENKTLQKLSDDLERETSSRLFDWIDHLELGYSQELEDQLLETGYISDVARPSYRVFHHPGAQLPMIIVRDDSEPFRTVAVKVDSIEDFLMVRGLNSWVEGSFLSKYRRCCISKENGFTLLIVERRGTMLIDPHNYDAAFTEKVLTAYQMWQARPRNAEIEDEEDGIREAISLAEKMVELVGQNKAAYIVLDVERRYWQARNTAGQIQKNRQDRLGMGWANHDHHTFRSSRKHFRSLVRLFEILGFHCRERFWAGQEAGWGAQVMEHPSCHLVLFLDVDLSSDEVAIDFAHHSLPELPKLGTIGLWCALHGESILKAGMHHLEAQFLFDNLHTDLAKCGIEMMDPFSSFPFLKQAFTKGEVWPVSHRRVESLVARNLISKEQAEKFLVHGAVGSHLENLQRREGYKGFNQKNVSSIIQKTDPRTIK